MIPPAAASAAVPRHALNGGLMALLATTMLFTASTIHYQTPALGAIALDFGVDAAAAGWVATGTFSGFLVGIVFLVPLGDRVDKRRLILVQHSLLVVSMLGMALAPTLPVLVAFTSISGALACHSQNIVPLVAELAGPSERGRAVATILTALFLGILFGRVGSGFIASHFGWRWTYVMSMAILLALTPALLLRLPRSPAQTTLPYHTLIGSLLQFMRSHAELRRVAGTQYLIGICYGGFWATVAPMLFLLHGLGPGQIGLMGIPGAAGILVARPAGRWMDRRGPVPVVTTGVSLVLAAFVVFGFAALWIGAVVIGAILMDCGLRSTMVANQTLVNSVVADARSRFNTVFAAHVWGGNATGAFLASAALARSGWLAVCAIGVLAAGSALVLHRRAARHLPPR